MNITKVKELLVPFRGSVIRVHDIEYEPGLVGRLNGAPEDCYPEEPEFVDFQVDSGNIALDSILESDLRDEMCRDVIRTLAREEWI